MKNLLIFVFAAALAGAATFGYMRWHTAKKEQATVALLKSQAEQAAQEAARQQRAREETEKERDKLLKFSDQMGAELKAAQQLATNKAPGVQAIQVSENSQNDPDPSSKPDFGKMVSSMMQDPAMKKMIQEQQRMMVDQMYKPFIKQAGMDPERAEAFKKLLTDRVVNATEKATSLFGGDSANRAEAIKAMQEEQKAADDEMKNFLGESGYAQYKEYEQTVGERAQLNMYRQQLAGGDTPLTDQQMEGLLALTREEKQKLASTGVSFPGAGDDPSKLESMLSEEQTDKLLGVQETLNQRVYDRAGTVLSAEQMESFASFQTNQLQMMRMGMTMARKMMGPQK